MSGILIFPRALSSYKDHCCLRPLKREEQGRGYQPQRAQFFCHATYCEKFAATSCSLTYSGKKSHKEHGRTDGRSIGGKSNPNDRRRSLFMPFQTPIVRTGEKKGVWAFGTGFIRIMKEAIFHKARFSMIQSLPVSAAISLRVLQMAHL